MEGRKQHSFGVPLLLLALSVFINYIDRGNLSIAAPLLKNQLAISASGLGILLSAFFWSYTAMLFVCGWFVDRFDASRVLALGYLVWSLSTAATGLVHGFAMLLLARLFLGMGESVAFPCYSKILAHHLPEHCRGFANGAIIAGMKLGPAVGTLGASLLIANYGWRPVFLGIGLVSLGWLPAWIKWMPRRETPAHFAGDSPRVIDILRQRPFWATAAGAFCVAYPLYFTITWLPFYLVREQHLSLRDMVHIAALYYIVDAAAALATGCRLLDSSRFGRRCGAQDSDGSGMDNGSRRFFRLRLRGTVFVSCVVDGSRCGLGNRKRKLLGIHSDAGWTASSRKVGGLAKWVRKFRRRYRAGINRLYSRLDRSFSGGNRNHGRRVPGRCLGLALPGWRIQGGEVVTSCRRAGAVT